MTTATPARTLPTNSEFVSGDVDAGGKNPNYLCESLDPADRERLLDCARGIRLREGGSLGWLTPWCGAELPSETMAKARVGVGL